MRFTKFNNPSKKRKVAPKRYAVIVYNSNTHDFIERVLFKSYAAAVDLCDYYAADEKNPVRAYIE